MSIRQRPPARPMRQAPGQPRQSQAGLFSSIMSELPVKLRGIVLVAMAVVTVLCVGLVIDSIANFGKIHAGVTVSGVDVSGMTEEEAAQAISDAFSDTVSNKTLTVFASEKGYKLASGSSETLAGAESTADAGTLSGVACADETAGGSCTSQDAETLAMERWTVSATDLGAYVDGEQTAKDAFSQGRNANFFFACAERIARWFTPYDLDYEVVLDDESFKAKYTQYDNAVGYQMVDVDINYEDGAYHAVEGSDGSMIDEEAFREDLSTCLEGHTDHVTLSMLVIPVANSIETAEQLAQTADESVSEPFVIQYEDTSWTVEASSYAPWFSATTVYDDERNAGLELTFDHDAAKTGLAGIMGEEVFGDAVNAHPTVEDGQVVIVEGSNGRGPDVNTALQTIDDYVSSNASGRTFTIASAVNEPEITADDVKTWGIVDELGSFYLNYDHGETGTDRCYNIERALSLVNDSVVAPGADWNWNDVVGECSEETGYRKSTVISNGVDVSDYGGGICNAATGVFNAAYEACLPIVERTNHSLYLSDYPTGRDATVSWDTPTLIFHNDTDHYILVHVDMDGSYMTVSIWGTSTGRTCTSKNSEWNLNEDGSKSITNYRDVLDKDGNRLWEDSFYSFYRGDG